MNAVQQLLADALSNGPKGHAARAKLAGMKQMGSAALAEFSEFFPSSEGEEELNVVEAEEDAEDADDGFSAEAMLKAPVKDVIDTLLQESKAEEIGFYSTHDEHGLVFIIHVPEGTEKSEIKELGETLWAVVQEEL